MTRMPSTSNGPVRVAPGLVLDDALYTAAAAGVAEHVPDLGPLTRATWTSPRWTRIPDEQTGEAYKAELTLAKSADRTVKINLWFAGDVRDPAGPRPHNHPWDFFSAILEGTYVEHRWTSHAGGVVPELDVEHHTGTLNTITRDVYHEVTEVEPGRTLTLMVSGATESAWGYMDPDTGLVTPAELPKGFTARLRELNPHQR